MITIATETATRDACPASRALPLPPVTGSNGTQLHWTPSLRAHSAAVLNLAPDHLDWHGSMEA
ncbi:hypothetical protein, partial [Streptomyces albidoflavus]|uniref:hypothetical protein n=1 Tax=Streptomyces albidoflavus TaxID=1886 RepID=UPI0033BC179D